MLRTIAELLKKYAFDNVPAALKPHLTQVRWQCLQLFDVVRLALHQGLVVRHPGWDVVIFVRILTILILAIHKQALEIAVTH